jgi:hypothetical protein
MNVTEGVGLCRACGTLARLRDVISIPQIPDGPPPAGCTLDDTGADVRVRASTRSVGTFAGALFFCLFWNGVVSVFVLVATAGVIQNLAGTVPSWFPAPVMNGSPMGWGITIFLWIFLIPFITVGVVMLGVVATAAAGVVEVRWRGGEGVVRRAVGPFAWTTRFDALAVRRIAIGETKKMQEGEAKPLIVLEADRTIRFGSMLTPERLAWMAGALHAAFASRARR